MTDHSETLPKINRQVDVRALVSHIVKGDGLDKCRICMGDTSQGQVHLGDTVMMDGDKPVTLSELLVLITGVEVSRYFYYNYRVNEWFVYFLRKTERLCSRACGLWVVQYGGGMIIDM